MKAIKSRFLSGPQRAVFIPPRTALAPCRAEIVDWLNRRRYAGKFQPQLHEHSDSIEIENIDFRSLLEACTAIRSTADIRCLVHEFKADNYNHFKSRFANFDWTSHFGDGAYRIKISSIRSRLYHESQLTDVCRKIMQNQGAQIDRRGPVTNALFVQLVEDHVRVWISLRGSTPQRRSYITEARSRASMRAPLVATLLGWGLGQENSTSGIHPRPHRTAIWNPFCGSGVFGFEMCALLEGLPHHIIAAEYPWQNWPFIPQPTRDFFAAKDRPATHPQDVSSLLLEDIDPRQVEAASTHLKHFKDKICSIDGEARMADFFQSEPWKIVADPFLVVANPPFGERLRPSDSMPQYFAAIGQRLNHIHEKNNMIAGGLIIAPSRRAADAFVKTFSKSEFSPETATFKTGGKTIEVIRF